MDMERPWPMPKIEECQWYHTMRFPDGEIRHGVWDIPDFATYLGGYDVRGKTVLDIGTASGFIAFSAERDGATVTALDARSTNEFRHVPFKGVNRAESIKDWQDHNLIPVRHSWWYSWHKFQSRGECTYTPHEELYLCDRQFDVVIAGAIIEHLSDPVFSIGAWANVAREAVIIPFTDIAGGSDMRMVPITPWTDAKMSYAWWQLSEGLWRRVFDNLGFDFSWQMAEAIHNADGSIRAHRPTIIARRR